VKTLFCMLVLTLGLGGCLGIPDGAEAVQGFELERYLGTWYEIARMDHSFERGLSRVTAEYSLRDGGGVNVVNSGFDTATGKWSEADGKAYFIGDSTVGQLKVSFFGPFYGAYNVIALDREDYQWSMVAGPDLKYLWILSRTPALEKSTLDKLIFQAAALGFNTGDLIYVSHEQK
jgi:apolipoprotein D and lipocalin family protein